MKGSGGTAKRGGSTTDMANVASPTASANVTANFWKDLELESLRGKLDEQGMRIAENQEASMTNRRTLADVTKNFKKGASAATLKEVGALLRQYQEEVDRLTQRAKFGESAFLDVYQKLYEAPDPAPALAAGLETASRVAELEAANQKLAQELGEFRAESAELRNQDLTIRRLEDRARALEAQLEEKERQVEEAKESAAAESNARVVAEMQEREVAMTGALAEAKASLANLRKLHQATQNQLFTMQSKTEEERAGLVGEVELATAEMERAQQRLMALENEKLALVQQLSSKDHCRENAAAAGSSAVEEKLRAELGQARELASLRHAELTDLQQRAADDAAAAEARVEGLRRALEAQEGHSDALEKELSARPTNAQVEALRQQIRVLQAVGYNAMEAEEGGAGQGGAGDAAEGATTSGLEAKLLEKNRHLEHELTMARLKAVEATGQAEASTSRVAELEAELAAQQRLVARLEEDVLAAQSRANGAGGGSGEEAAESNGLSGTMSGILDMDGGEEGGERTMVAVLCSQRDRFRKRCQELEEGIAKVGADAGRLRKELEAARADNVALVERLRYVQGYQGARRKGSGTDPEAGDAEGRYAGAYAANLDPFGAFRSRERESRRAAMGLPDRVVFAAGQLVATNKYARLFAVGYTLVLHLLIFAVLVRLSHHHASAEVLCARQVSAAHGAVARLGTDAAAAATTLNQTLGAGLGTRAGNEAGWEARIADR